MTNDRLPALTRLTEAFRSPAALCGYPENTPVLLALSGGADSRLLLHLLAEQAAKTGVPLHLAHLHHGIRGESADRDAAFCAALAAEYGLPYHERRVDVPALAKASGRSLEEVGREARYAFFAEIMQRECIPLLATAHHADDALETLLLHLTRGCGTAGLAGIPSARLLEAAACDKMPLPPMLTRPLLSCAKEDILAALEALSLTYVTDETNRDISYTRNALRHKVLPPLYEVAPHARSTAARAMEALREDDAYLNELADAFLSQYAQDGRLPRLALTAAPRPIAKRALARHIRRHTGVIPSYAHLDALLALCSHAAGELHLPKGIVIMTQGEHLLLHRGPASRDRRESSPSTTLRPLKPGTFLWNRDIEISLCVHEHAKNTQKTKNVYNSFIRDTLTFDTIMECVDFCAQSAWVLRPRQQGDTLLFHGLHRRVRKLQNQAGIPPSLRERLPLLCDRTTGEILWVPFIGIRDGLDLRIHEDISHHTYTLTIQVLPYEASTTQEDQTT